MLNSIDDIISLHTSEGRIEDAYQKISFDSKTFNLNKYSVRISRGNMTKEEAKRWNLTIYNEIKKDRNLYKEVREFNSVFQLINRLGIKSGYLKKYESPDFIISRNEKNIGIEITKIYVGNDWIAERISEEIQAFKDRKRDIASYDEYRKFRSKIVSFKIRGGIVIMPSSENKVSTSEYIIEIKNKIFEKIRKLIDDYRRFDENIIFAEVVSPLFFSTEKELESLNQEMSFYISHLDGFADDRNYRLVLKTSTGWTSFNLKNGTYTNI